MLTLEYQSTKGAHIARAYHAPVYHGYLRCTNSAQLAFGARSVHMGSTGLDKSLRSPVRQAGQDKLDTCLAAQQAAP